MGSGGKVTLSGASSQRISIEIHSFARIASFNIICQRSHRKGASSVGFSQKGSIPRSARSLTADCAMWYLLLWGYVIEPRIRCRLFELDSRRESNVLLNCWITTFSFTLQYCYDCSSIKTAWNSLSNPNRIILIAKLRRLRTTELWETS